MPRRLQKTGLKSVLFRVDAGADIGIGHYKRCVALAEYLDENLELESIFLTRSDTVVSLNSPKRWRTIRISDDQSTAEEIQATSELIVNNDINVMFVDCNNSKTTQESYFFYLKEIKALGVFLVSFDDFRICPSASDLVVIPYAGAEKMDMNGGSSATYLLGPRYFVLGANFLKERQPPHNRPARSIMVCLGGADVNNLTETIVASIIAATNDIHLNIVRGPCAADWSSDFKRRLEDGKISHTIFDAPDNLVQIMKNSTIGVFSSGLTPYEASAVGLPSVIVSLNTYHREVVDRLAKTNSIISFGTFEDMGANALGQTTADLMNDKDKIDAMSASGRETVDGQGMERIIYEIVNRVG